MVGKMQQSRNCAAFKIIAAGPVVIEDGMTPCRVVLRRKDGGFVTHKQGVAGRRHHLHACFSAGHYFLNGEHGPTGAWQKALADFCSRIQDHSLAIHPAKIIDG
jgi:hypothetical protein